MQEKTWTAVESYFDGMFLSPDPLLDSVLAEIDAAGLPAISVTPSQGKFLNLLIRMLKARSVLEIGTLGAYSTIWMARALPPDGRLITLESEAANAEVAQANIARAGLRNIVELRLGRALDTLPKLVEEGAGPFDLVFIDADKPSNADYFAWAMKMTRKGSVIILDNIARSGAVADNDSSDRSVLGVRRFSEAVAADPRVSATAIQTVGSKGYDGFAMVLVTDDV